LPRGSIARFSARLEADQNMPRLTMKPREGIRRGGTDTFIGITARQFPNQQHV
jgi:hypothetical protein